MFDIVEKNREELIELCQENEIKGLWLFGSAVESNYDPNHSDLDFLFDIGHYDHTAAGRWMALNVGLLEIIGDNFDLVSRPAIKGQDFRKKVDETAVPIYERQD